MLGRVFSRRQAIEKLGIGAVGAAFVSCAGMTATKASGSGAIAGPWTTPVTSRVQAIARASASVVRIHTEDGRGSGVLVDGRGHILTNEHVVRPYTKVWVGLSDASWLDGYVVARDALRDVALVRATGSAPQPIKVGRSSEVRVGEEVVAIGYPLGLAGDPTATLGMVSAKRAELVTLPNVPGTAPAGPSIPKGPSYIQIDAAINSGSSGGALINSRGELIGINTAAIRAVEDVGQADGVALAIPIDEARAWADRIIAQIAALPGPAAEPTVTPAPTPGWRVGMPCPQTSGACGCFEGAAVQSAS